MWCVHSCFKPSCVVSYPSQISTFNMYPLQLNISFSNSTTFSIQSAGYAYAYSGNGTLYTQGCNDNDLTSPNCSSACQNASQIFSNPYTLQNCMVLSALAPNDLNQGANLSGASVEVASNFAIDVMDPDFPSLAINVTRTIQGCLLEYCNPQNCSDNINTLSSSPWYLYYYTTFSPNGSTNTTDLPVYNLTCPLGVLNADIGGIGVRQRDAPSMTKNPF